MPRFQPFMPYSDRARERLPMARNPFPLALALAAMLSGASAPGGVEMTATIAPSAKPGCIAESETREEIKAHRLLEPFVVLKSAGAALKAEALRARLCRIGDDLVYEITLLHRDGRVVHIVVDAATGKRLPPRPPRETREPPKP